MQAYSQGTSLCHLCREPPHTSCVPQDCCKALTPAWETSPCISPLLPTNAAQGPFVCLKLWALH